MAIASRSMRRARDVGGKATSQFVDGTATGGRERLPGEHGFRFYPSFYKHLIRTMQEIPSRPVDPEPSGGGGQPVARAPRQVSRPSTRLRAASVPEARSTDYARRGRHARHVLQRIVGVGSSDAARFGQKVLRYFASCRARRGRRVRAQLQGELPRAAIGYRPPLPALSPGGPAHHGRDGPAGEAARRTIGDISMQLIEDYGASRGGNSTTGPCSSARRSEAWIDPRRAYLEQCGVKFHVEASRRLGLEFDEVAGRVTGARDWRSRLDGPRRFLRRGHAARDRRRAS